MTNSSPQSITVSAPAKLFLLGEHAVIYQGMAIVSALSARLYVRITPIPETVLRIDAPDVGLEGWERPLKDVLTSPDTINESKFIEGCLALFHSQYPLPDGGGLHFETWTRFKREYGLGSSSATIAATLFALGQLAGVTLTPDTLFEMGLQVILNVQKRLGSGADLAAAIYGGTLIYFNQEPRRVEKIPLELLPAFAVYSGRKAGTVNYVERVRDLLNRHPKVVEPILETMLTIVDEGKEALLAQDWARLGELMNIQHGLLDAVGVNTQNLAYITFLAREWGALGAKLSGAGGGDCAIVLTEPKRLKEIFGMFYEGFTDPEKPIRTLDYHLNAEGLRIED